MRKVRPVVRSPFVRILVAVSLCAVALGATIPVAEAATGAAIRITEFAYGGKASGAGGSDGEYVELTNTGDVSQDLTGWTYGNKDDTSSSGLSLSPLGAVAPGVSVIVTDLSDAEFRSEWGLVAGVKVLSNGKTHTLNSGPNAIRVYDDAGAEIDSLTYAAGFQSAKGKSAWVDAAHLGARADTTGWTIATDGDAEGSWTSAGGSVGSPGASKRGTKTPGDVRTGGGGGSAEAPCDTEDAGSAPGTVPAAATTWPGGASPATADPVCDWVTSLSGQDVSGLAFDPSDAGVLYAVKNKSHVYRLVKSGGTWVKDATNGWTTGKDIRFPGGSGLPDAEGLVVGPDGALYVTTERDNTATSVPLDSILRFDPAGSGTTLTATDQWTLTTDLGFTASADANLGFEGVAFVPDGFLTASGFREDDGTLFDPAAHAGRIAPGLFLGAVEKTGRLRAYVLNTNHTFSRVADIATGMVGVMDASYDPDLGRVWAHCDNTCGNATALLKIGADGHFAVDHHYRTPANLPNYNFEGFAVAPVSSASGGTRQVLWTDDGNRFGHSLWAGTLNVALGLAQTRTPTPTINGSAGFGGTLVAQVGAWDPGVTTSYQWKDGSTVLGSNAPLSLDDPAVVGRTISLVVTGSKTGFVTATSTASVTIAAAGIATSPVTIVHRRKVGAVLVANPGSWSASGRTVTFSYRWYVGRRVVQDGGSSGLRLKRAFRHKRVRVEVTGTAPGHAPATISSARTVRIR